MRRPSEPGNCRAPDAHYSPVKTRGTTTRAAAARITAGALLAPALLAAALLGASSASAAAPTASLATAKGAKPATGTASHHGIVVTGAFLPLPPSAAVASAYFVIRNQTRRPDALLSAGTTVASQTMAMSEDTTSMAMLGPVTIPAHGRVAFTPGHDHLMLQDLHRSLQVGQRVAVRLVFRHAGTIRLQVPVVPLDRILGAASSKQTAGKQTRQKSHDQKGKK